MRAPAAMHGGGCVRKDHGLISALDQQDFKDLVHTRVVVSRQTQYVCIEGSSSRYELWEQIAQLWYAVHL